MQVTCGGCNTARDVKPTTRGQARLPRGWKRRPNGDGDEAVLCGNCWGKLYRLRAITFPVASVLQGGTWTEFCAAVRQALFRSRTLAQWAVNQLAATDVTRTLADDRLPPHPPLGKEGGVYLYGLASRQFADWEQWAGAYNAAQSVLRSVEMKYNARRREIVWSAEASVPTIRSQPYPVPAANYSVAYVEYTGDGETEQVTRVPAVTLPLGTHRWQLRLRGGVRRRRQLAAFRQMVSGEAVLGELAIYRKRAESNRRRSGSDERTSNGGGARVRYDIMVKLVAWLPREQRQGQRVRQGVLSVHSSRQAFLVAVHPDFERPWVLNRAEVRRRIESHARRLEQMSNDAKAETREPVAPRCCWRALSPAERQARRQRKRARRHRLDYLERICLLYRNYVDTFVKEAAAWLAAYADRVGVAKVYLDLSEHGYCPGFPWAALRDRIAVKLDEYGIELTLALPKENNEDEIVQDTISKERQPD